MKAFLSSTYKDLIEHRKLAVEALERLGQEVGRMEVFGARPEEPTMACLREIESCDVFIGIYAHCYGFVPSNSETSITEAEYNHAVELKKPVFCFVVNEDYAWPPKLIEDYPAKSKLQSFKQKIKEALVRDDFTTPEALAFKIASSVGRYLTQSLLPPESRDLRDSQTYEHKSIERVLKLRVHQAHFVNSSRLHYFVNATNLSPNRVLELTHIWYEDEDHHIPVMQASRLLPVRLDVDQSWETWIDVYDIPEPRRFNAFENFRARISTGSIFTSEHNLDVPPYGFVPGGQVKNRPDELVAINSAVQDSTVFGADRSVTRAWSEIGLEQCNSIARVETKDGRAIGTGFLVNANEFVPSLNGVLLVTADHIMGDFPFQHSIPPEDVQVRFQALNETFEIDRKVWCSPYTDLDVAVLLLKGQPKAPPLTIHKRPIKMTTPSPSLYIIGHPQGRDLEISLRDNYLLACNDRVLHYTTSWGPGSSGSPVFESTDWEVVAVHHKGSSSMKRLDGQGTYEVNEGIAILAVLTAMRESLY